MKKKILNVAVTGGTGAIAYNLLFRVASGEMFGWDQPISLRILELPQFMHLQEGVAMELEDCAYPVLKEIKFGSDPLPIFKDLDVAILVGAKPRGPGMERSDLLLENAQIFVKIGRALNEVAKRECKVFVVGNPCNTNCLITLHNAPDLPRQNFHAMTRLDQNRATSMLARKAGTGVENVTRMTIWGNHSNTQVPDYTNAQIHGEPVSKVITDRQWLEGEFPAKVQKRGAEIIAIRGKSSAASAATAIVDDVRSVIHPTPSGQWYSSAIYAKGNPYGIDGDLVYSFPCRTLKDGTIEIVKDLPLNHHITEGIRKTERELIDEREIIKSCLHHAKEEVSHEHKR